MRGKKPAKTREYLKRLRKSPYPRRKVMSEPGTTNSNGDIVKDFQSTGRTGRRNAMADVLDAHKDVSTSDLPLKLEKLSTSDDLTASVAECSATKQNNCINNNGAEDVASSGSSPSTATSSS